MSTAPPPPPNVPTQAPQSAGEPRSNPELFASAKEYEHLISYFKYLVTITLAALALIIGVGSFFFYKNMSDVKSDARSAIDSTRESASHEIANIQSNAGDIAR